MELQSTLVRRKDVTFEVHKDDSKLGTLLISRGNIEWVPAGNSVNKRRMSWTKFAKLMESDGSHKKMK
jgi:hypothetical protein